MTLEDTSRSIGPCPGELTGPTPRKVRLNLNSNNARFALIVISFFFVGFGILLGAACFSDVRQFRQRAELRSGGHDVVGEVTKVVYPRHAPKVVKYRFSVEGAQYSGEAKAPFFATPGTILHEYDQILVRYLPSNPNVNHPEAWEWSPLIGIVDTAFQVFFFSMGSVALIVLLRERALAREGKIAEGFVTSCRFVDRTFRIDYEFRTPDGATIRGKGDCRKEYRPGARVWILYMPEQPRRNDTYPLSLFEVVG